MKRRMKKLIATVLTVAMTMSIGAPVFAETSTQSIYSDNVYAQNLTETTNIKGVDYTYHYFYNEDGDEVIGVTDHETGCIDYVVKDKETSIIYISATPMINSEAVNTNLQIVRAGWTLIASDSAPIPQEFADDVYAAAAIISAGFQGLGIMYVGVPGISAAVIISNIGLSALQRYVDRTVGGIATGTLYQMVSGGVVQLRLDWTYTDLDGVSFGPYNSYWTVNPYSLGGEII